MLPTTKQNQALNSGSAKRRKIPSSSSFGCGAGDHKFPPATAVMDHG